MLTYETIVTILLSEAERSGLNLQYSQEQLDPHTLSRTFTMTTLPAHISEPRLYVPFATLGFTWDAALTAISVQGSDAVCDVYHLPDEPCLHSDIGCAYEAALDIDASYEIPVSSTQRNDIREMQTFVQSVQALTRSIMPDEQALAMDVQMAWSPQGQATVSRVTAKQQWTIDEPLHDEADLHEVMRDICRELSITLLVLTGDSPMPASEFEDDEDDDHDPLIDLRIYLRPPTA